jgi:CRP/FNR family transcriptional regulator, cyclic AMP receptor protein
VNQEITAKIDDFFAKYKLRHYAKGQILILSGDQSDYVYRLVTGNVKQYDVTYRGDEIILNIFKPPAFFPMSLAINKVPNPYIYEAETDIEIRQAPAEEVIDFIKANPDVLFDLLSRVYRGVDGLLGRMAHLMSSSARSRLIYELVIEAQRFGEPQKNGEYIVNISEKDLGARAGLSRETVSRELSKLKTEGLVAVRSKDLLLKDFSALERKLGQEL